jgi:NAD(P)-dependent dehydrogenase (short-subunit alcohol dehydrogenase family)
MRIIQIGPFERMTLDDFEEAMRVHLFGPLYTTMAALPHMQSLGGGRIVNISSIGGKVAAPHIIPHTASKFALVGLSNGLRTELRRHNVFVTTVCPGFLRTGSPLNTQVKGRHRQDYAWFAIAEALPLLSIDARRAARRILAACRRRTPPARRGPTAAGRAGRPGRPPC